MEVDGDEGAEVGEVVRDGCPLGCAFQKDGLGGGERGSEVGAEEEDQFEEVGG